VSGIKLSMAFMSLPKGAFSAAATSLFLLASMAETTGWGALTPVDLLCAQRGSGLKAMRERLAALGASGFVR